MPQYDGPERRARQRIDASLTASGWTVQSRDEINLSAARGVAIREFKMEPGFGYADYLLFVDGRSVGALEAKKEGYPLTGVEPQVKTYSDGLPSELTAPHRPLASTARRRWPSGSRQTRCAHGWPAGAALRSRWSKRRRIHRRCALAFSGCRRS